jgi:O-antigen/teichoic acid export membrane protein
LQDRALHGAVWTLVNTAVSLPIAFAVNLVIARVLGAVEYGGLAFLTALIEIAGGVVMLGLNPALIQFGSKAHAGGRTSEVRSMLSASQGFRLLVAAPALTLLVVLVAHVPLPLLVLAIVFGIWVPAVVDGAAITLTLENKTAAAAKIVTLGGILTQAAVLAALLTLGTADSVWAARVVAGGLVIALTLIPVDKRYRSALFKATLPRRFPSGFWRFAIPTGIAGLVGTLVVSRTEVFFLTWLSPPAAVGVFALAFGLASHLFAPAQALINPLLPAISGLREVDLDAVSGAFTRTLRTASTIIGLICGVALAPLAALVPALYSEQYRASAPLLLALGSAGGLLVLAGPVSAFALARLSARRMLTANLVALGVDLALAVTLIPLLDAWGAVIANVGGATTRLLIMALDELPHVGVTKREAIRSSTPIAAGTLSSIFAWLVATAISRNPITAAVLATVIGPFALIAMLKVSNSGLAPSDAVVIERVAPVHVQGPLRRALRLVTVREAAV